MYVEGRVLTTEGEPVPDAVIDTWEADQNGMSSVGCTDVRAYVLTAARVLRHAICRQNPPGLSWAIAYRKRWQLRVSCRCSLRLSHSGRRECLSDPSGIPNLIVN